MLHWWCQLDLATLQRSSSGTRWDGAVVAPAAAVFVDGPTLTTFGPTKTAHPCRDSDAFYHTYGRTRVLMGKKEGARWDGQSRGLTGRVEITGLAKGRTDDGRRPTTPPFGGSTDVNPSSPVRSAKVMARWTGRRTRVPSTCAVTSRRTARSL